MPTPAGYADISVELVQSGLARSAYITFGVDPTETDPALVAQSVHGALTTAGSLMSRMDSSVTLTSVRASLGTDGGEDLVGVFPSTATGGLSGAATLPPNCAVLCHKRSGRGGRRGRGRLFIPWWVAETDVDETGTIAATPAGQMQTAINTFRTTLVTNSVPMVILHGPGKTSIPAPDVVSSITVDRLIGTQRRRLGR